MTVACANGNYLFYSAFVSVQMTECPDASVINRFSLQPPILR